MEWIGMANLKNGPITVGCNRKVGFSLWRYSMGSYAVSVIAWHGFVHKHHLSRGISLFLGIRNDEKAVVQQHKYGIGPQKTFDFLVPAFNLFYPNPVLQRWERAKDGSHFFAES